MHADEIRAKARELWDPSDPAPYLATRPGREEAVPGSPPGRTHTFPLTSGMRASFVPEGLAQKLFKLIRTEIQTGDAPFDGVVYIRTSTPDITAAFLASEEVRAAIGRIVGLGGDVRVTGDSCAITVWGAPSGPVLPEGALAQLLAHIEATAR